MCMIFFQQEWQQVERRPHFAAWNIQDPLGHLWSGKVTEARRNTQIFFPGYRIYQESLQAE